MIIKKLVKRFKSIKNDNVVRVKKKNFEKVISDIVKKENLDTKSKINVFNIRDDQYLYEDIDQECIKDLIDYSKNQIFKVWFNALRIDFESKGNVNSYIFVK